MMKFILTSVSAFALLALAACDDGAQPPQSGGEQTDQMTTTPAPDAGTTTQ